MFPLRRTTSVCHEYPFSNKQQEAGTSHFSGAPEFTLGFNKVFAVHFSAYFIVLSSCALFFNHCYFHVPDIVLSNDFLSLILTEVQYLFNKCC